MIIFIQTTYPRISVARLTLSRLLHWGDTNCPIYIGLALQDRCPEAESDVLTQLVPQSESSCLDSIRLVVSEPGDWASELSTQLLHVKRIEESKHICLFLDDFYLTEPLDYLTLNDYFQYASEHTIRYLSLVKQRRSIWGELYTQAVNILDRERGIAEYTDTHYPCALQAAIWDIDYLCELLKTASQPWQFERQPALHVHYVVKFTVVRYIHIVEKNSLRYESLRYFRSTEQFTELRLVRESRRKALIDKLKCLKFQLVGYLFSK